jgi:hypothetical protein
MRVSGSASESLISDLRSVEVIVRSVFAQRTPNTLETLRLRVRIKSTGSGDHGNCNEEDNERRFGGRRGNG